VLEYLLQGKVQYWWPPGSWAIKVFASVCSRQEAGGGRHPVKIARLELENWGDYPGVLWNFEMRRNKVLACLHEQQFSCCYVVVEFRR
jgi:hypothetical protein